MLVSSTIFGLCHANHWLISDYHGCVFVSSQKFTGNCCTGLCLATFLKRSGRKLVSSTSTPAVITHTHFLFLFISLLFFYDILLCRNQGHLFHQDDSGLEVDERRSFKPLLPSHPNVVCCLQPTPMVDLN